MLLVPLTVTLLAALGILNWLFDPYNAQLAAIFGAYAAILYMLT